MFSLYDASVPVFLRTFRNLDALLDKGAAWCAEQGRPESELTSARLVADMLPLTGQIQRASDTAKGVCARVGGLEVPPMADEEQSIADLKERIAKTIAVLAAAPRSAFDGKEDALVELKTPRGTMMFDGRGYVLDFAVPNVFFHVTMAYALLRQAGVGIGKMDYLGPVQVRAD